MVKLASIVPWFISGLAVAVLLSVIAVHAEQTSFTSALSAENKAASGIVKLTAQQIAALDAQVQREISVAHQGDTVAFSTSFTHRRSPQQRNEAGLDQLMTPELARLDALVAAALAERPLPAAAGPLIIAPATSASPDVYVETLTRKMEVHGEVTLAYVMGSGGARGYGASMVTTATDPSGKFAITVGVSQFYGKGFRRYYPGEYECDRGW